MAEFLTLIGFFGGIACFIWFIIRLIKRTPKKPVGISFLACFAALIVGGILYSPKSTETDVNGNPSNPPSAEITEGAQAQKPSPEQTKSEQPSAEPTVAQSELRGTDLFEEIYVPYAEREKARIFYAVKEYAPNSGYEYEIAEPSDNTPASVKFLSGSDYVYIAFAPGVEDIELMMTVSYYQARTNSEVSMSNYSPERSALYDKFQTHIIGESPNDVPGINEQREFLFESST